MSEKEDSATRIRQAAVEVLMEVGVRAATTRMVTERAGVGRGLLNHYFRWSELRAEAWGEIFDQLMEWEAAQSADPRVLMEDYLKTAFEERNRIYWFLWIDATDLAKTDAALAVVTTRVHKRMLEQLASYLSRGTEQGFWQVADALGTALRLSAMYDGLANMLLTDFTDLSPAQAEQHLRHLFFLETRPILSGSQG
ncbi:TetR family transcriptional regulator C-terminal domain-containing protein [Alcaligenes nematophilus]|uniref:TetR family transcriptional regulator C-terminal domain-containing protein n=1 Tax=Alcaligenes nematophilus TaxID=2994643 RepID=A0ABU3MR14_9BURK|nr:MULTISPECIES: TetR family transcriptional regulator C-terminal domain-containing protein [Alcaligenes]MDT8463478.1 TetR family transcriptional regulator C-terminal domain-containing protein [Alcaligenes nematophilus]MDT8469908.1 TetR family transcriptional regulator C-terminal domain-containing protein [Alcaligenes nematophilus]MDT8502734.1 TetR family transcriptional regulator C-terminal domain-containing protein [Alcaligenes nematophilus]MDT8525589.1 TetR family transcriptional regulator C